MYNQNERKIIADLNAKLYRKERKIYWLNKRVEAQQQEIDRLKHNIDNLIKWNEEHVTARSKQRDRIEQLEDAIKCRGFSAGCCDKNKKRCSAGGVGICIENAACTALTYREMLEEVIKHLSHCPFCKINRPWLYKHKDGCELAALLKESEVEEG